MKMHVNHSHKHTEVLFTGRKLTHVTVSDTPVTVRQSMVHNKKS